MTIETQNTRDVATGDGAETEFPFTFYLPEAFDSYIQVYVDGELIDPPLSGYSIEHNDNFVGGNVVFDDPPDLDADLLFVRVVPYTQPVDLIVEGNFDEEKVELIGDKNMMAIQQLAEQLNRALLGPIATEFSAALPDPVAGYLLAFNADGTAFEAVSAAEAFATSSPDAGAGDVVGPASSINHAPVLFNGITGKLLKTAASAGTVGQVFTSNGPATDGTFQDPTGLTPGNTIGDIPTWDGDSYEPAAPAGISPYISNDITIVNKTTTTLAHGRGRVPYFVEVVLVCQVANGGYSPGAVISLNTAYPIAGSHLTVEKDATNIKVRTGNRLGGMAFYVAGPTSGQVAINLTKWKFRVYAL
jgi:hypothetical protein